MHTDSIQPNRETSPASSAGSGPVPVGQHIETLNCLQQALVEQRGINVLTGAPGTGKTTLIQALAMRLTTCVRIGRITSRRAAYRELLASVATAFGLDCSAHSSVILYKQINGFLDGCHLENQRALLIVDDAHRLSRDNLEQLRLLSEINASRRPLFQLLLVGDEGLEETLHSSELAPLSQRIESHLRLPPFSAEETYLYVQHRIRHTGDAARRFNAPACRLIYQGSHGIARKINRICDTLLRQIDLHPAESITTDLVTAACRDQTTDASIRQRANDGLMGPSQQTAPKEITDETRPVPQSLSRPIAPEEMALAVRLAGDVRKRRQRKHRVRRLVAAVISPASGWRHTHH